jgi:fructose-1,6-bisphosphatase I
MVGIHHTKPKSDEDMEVFQATTITTFQQHILQQTPKVPEASTDLFSLLSGITLAAKTIEAKIRRAGLSGILGAAGQTNIQGEAQQRLDVFANESLLHCLGVRASVAALVSEENDEPITFDRKPGEGEYVIVFDPLDGSSNIDVNVNVGTIFSIFKRRERLTSNALETVLRPGRFQVAAGYILYGPSTMLVYTAGRGVYGFTLDPSIGEFVLSYERMKMPRKGSYYSCNEANIDLFPASYRSYLYEFRCHEDGARYSSRYIGSLVADFHRTLLKGGIFLYPPTRQHPFGKLRLLYEANPLAMIAEQAGGLAINGVTPILDLRPETIHQRTPVVIGGCDEVGEFLKFVSEPEFQVSHAG